VSARSFYEPILVTEFVAKYFNLRDLSRPLSDQDRVKVTSLLTVIHKVILANYPHFFSFTRLKFKYLVYIFGCNFQVKRALRGIKVEISYRDYARSFKVTGISNLPVDKTM
jgi:eukaryotic translation initiation factor 2C